MKFFKEWEPSKSLLESHDFRCQRSSVGRATENIFSHATCPPQSFGFSLLSAMGMWLFETSDEKHIELTQLQHSNFVVDCNPAGAHLHSSP
jgi:hypothetical protein